MRIVINITILVVLALSIVSCGKNPKLNNTTPENSVEELEKMEKGEEINLRISATPTTESLAQAIEEQNLANVEEILSRQPILLNRSINDQGETPLHLSIRVGSHPGSLWLLEQKELNLIKPNENGDSYILYAAKYNQMGIIKALMEINEKSKDLRNLDFVNKKNQRAIHHAQSAEVFSLLFQNGLEKTDDADTVLFADISGKNPLHYAALRGNAEILDWVIDKICKKELYRNFVEFPRLYGDFLWTARPYNQRDRDGNSPLHLALLAKDSNSIRAILACPYISATLKNKMGHSPLHFAVFTQDREAFSTFLESRKTPGFIRNIQASLQARDNEFGNSPLHYAAKEPDRFFYDYLVNMGGKQNLLNYSQETPEQIFRKYRNLY